MVLARCASVEIIPDRSPSGQLSKCAVLPADSVNRRVMPSYGAHYIAVRTCGNRGDDERTGQNFWNERYKRRGILLLSHRAERVSCFAGASLASRTCARSCRAMAKAATASGWRSRGLQPDAVDASAVGRYQGARLGESARRGHRHTDCGPARLDLAPRAIRYRCGHLYPLLLRNDSVEIRPQQATVSQ